MAVSQRPYSLGADYPSRTEKNGLRWLWIAVVVIVADQITKTIAVASIGLHQRVPVIPGFFDWTLAYNKGIAFSMFNDGHVWQRYGLATLAIVVSIAFLVWMTRLQRGERASAVAIALVIGGAIGNVIDRLRLGHVVDFVLVYWKDWSWPAFNVADSAICIGAVLLVLAGFGGKPAHSRRR